MSSTKKGSNDAQLFKKLSSTHFAPLPKALGGSNVPNPQEIVPDFLRSHVPKSDQKEIESELKKPLPLQKQAKKKIKSSLPGQKAGKYLTAREKRDLGNKFFKARQISE